MPTLDLQVAASADDAFQDSGGSVNTTAAEHLLLAGSTWLGLRFTAVTIPPGSIVSAATLQIYAPNTKYDSVNADIYGQAADNPAAFTAATNGISSRPRTTSKATWTGDLAGPGWRAAPDLAAVVQEIIDRPGWASGNALALICDDINCGLSVRTWDYAGHAHGAQLDITYTTPVPVSARLAAAATGSATQRPTLRASAMLAAAAVATAALQPVTPLTVGEAAGGARSVEPGTRTAGGAEAAGGARGMGAGG